MLSDPEVSPLIIETANAYANALKKGIEKRDIPADMLYMLQENTFIFSGFKTHAELSEVSALLMDNGKLKPFEKFKQDVKAIDRDYNTNYLRAEYNFAVSSSRSAAMWADLSKDSDKYYLQYRTAKDERVRAEHATLDEITLPADDPFWKDYFPPNGWNCRCTVVKVRRSKYTESNSEEAIKRGIKATTKINKKGQNKAAIFRFNPGIEHAIFPPRHPYYKASKSNKKKISDATNDVKQASDIKNVLKISKGKPMTFEEANELRGNIDYGKGKQFFDNCQSCVVANELRRRGYNVTARGYSYNHNSITHKVSTNPTLPWIDPRTGENPIIIKCDGTKIDKKTGKDSKPSISQLTKDLNEATKEVGRYHIGFVYKDWEKAHIITLERLKDNTIQIYDPQDGDILSWDVIAPDISLEWGVDVIRVDNLNINTSIINGLVRKI